MVLTLLALVTVAACSDDSPAADTPTTSAAAPARSDTTAATGAVDAPTSTAVATTSVAATTIAPTTTVAVVESPLAAVGIPGIRWTSPSTGAGDRPTLAWEAAADAVEYRLVVTDVATGRPIWAWQGSETSVPLGAGMVDGQEGPRLAAPATVDVFALGADGTIVAASGPQPIAP